jgi:hypothetical protein
MTVTEIGQYLQERSGIPRLETRRSGEEMSDKFRFRLLLYTIQRIFSCNFFPLIHSTLCAYRMSYLFSNDAIWNTGL